MVIQANWKGIMKVVWQLTDDLAGAGCCVTDTVIGYGSNIGNFIDFQSMKN